MMARILLLLVLVVGVSSKYYPRIRRNADEDVLKRVSCGNDEKRNELIQKSLCGEPREVFVELKLSGSYLQIVPSFVWVKRCVGLCSYDSPGSKCGPTTTKTESVPVRLYNAKTNKESCATYDVVVHETCGCLNSSVLDCNAPQLYNPRKFSCQCPNTEERRDCLKKRKINHSYKWNRSKCLCESRRSIR